MSAPVPIDPAEAAGALADIDAIAARVKQSRSYRLASAALILWGVIVALGYTAAQFWPRSAPILWSALHVTGVILMVLLGTREARERGRGYDPRLLFGVLLCFVFGLIWSLVIGRFGPREMSAFWPTLFMFAYTLAGLWLGRAFVALGLAVTALTLAGYVFAGPWFDLYLAVVNGGGLMACGLWMRRA